MHKQTVCLHVQNAGYWQCLIGDHNNDIFISMTFNLVGSFHIALVANFHQSPKAMYCTRTLKIFIATIRPTPIITAAMDGWIITTDSCSHVQLTEWNATKTVLNSNVDSYLSCQVFDLAA